MQSYTCFLINLEKDKDRLTFMENELKKLNISYERFSAIYGKNVSNQELNTLYDEKVSVKENKVPMNSGEIGCALSHWRIYEKIVQNKIPYTLVLEDDVAIDKTFTLILDSEIKKQKTQKHWDYLSFDYYAYGFQFLSLWFPGVVKILKSKKNILEKIIFLCILFLKFLIIVPTILFEEIQKKLYRNSAIKTIRPIHFTGAYLVTYEGAKKLLSVHHKIIYTSDRLPNIAKKREGLQFLIYTPLIVKQQKDIFTSNVSHS